MSSIRSVTFRRWIINPCRACSRSSASFRVLNFMFLPFLLLLFFDYVFDELLGLSPEFFKCAGEHGTEEQPMMIREGPVDRDLMHHVGGTLHWRSLKGDAFDALALGF